MTGSAVRRACVVVLALVTFVASAAPAGAGLDRRDDEVRSVVALGDSVAAGESARDGYVYRDRVLLPGWSTTRPTPRTGAACGRSTGAYGARVARAIGADFTNLACSGASFERGIVLDERFDRAAPDVVLVTAGANSVAFERAYAYCVLSTVGVSEPEAERIASASSIDDALVTALDLAARRAVGREPAPTASACTAEHPGAFLRRTVLDRATTVGASARDLARAIRARGRALGTVPEIVFTTYPNPLPRAPASLAVCPDAAGLGADELAFVHRMLTVLDDALRDGLADVPGVRVADADPAFAGHRWCDADPWVHGPSIFVTDPGSRAPFHPTLAGQRAIAAAVLATLGAGPDGGPRTV